MPTLSELDLRAHIRSQLSRGALPAQAAHQKIYGGYGANQECDGCGTPIEATDVLYEVDAGTSSLALHRRCFDAWLLESRRFSGVADTIGSVIVADRLLTLR